MPKFTLELSQAEAEKLLELVYLGESVINGYRQKRLEDYAKVAAKIYELGEKAGLAHLAGFEPELDGFYPTAELEEGRAMEFKDDYADDLFWDELTQRLGERDLEVRFGLKEVEKLDPEARGKAYQDAEQPYAEEFVAHGIDRMQIVPGSRPERKH